MDPFLVLLKYAFLGLLQGITEPIPISSSGHLIIAERLLGLSVPGLGFEVFVHFASLLAILTIYRNDIFALAQKGTRFLFHQDPGARPDFMFIIYLGIATLPAAVIGVLFGDVIENRLQGLETIGAMLLVTGIALWLIRRMRGSKHDRDLSLKDALIVGFAQAIALIPGISRSGATIVAAMGVGMKQATALRFAFLLYIPTSLGGLILEAGDITGDPHFNQLLIPYMIAFLFSFTATYFSLKWLMNIMARGNLGYFTIYCFIAGLLVLLFL